MFFFDNFKLRPDGGIKPRESLGLNYYYFIKSNFIVILLLSSLKPT